MPSSLLLELALAMTQIRYRAGPSRKCAAYSFATLEINSDVHRCRSFSWVVVLSLSWSSKSLRVWERQIWPSSRFAIFLRLAVFHRLRCMLAIKDDEDRRCKNIMDSWIMVAKKRGGTPSSALSWQKPHSSATCRTWTQKWGAAIHHHSMITNRGRSIRRRLMPRIIGV
jgi:hypothetical protein